MGMQRVERWRGSGDVFFGERGWDGDGDGFAGLREREVDSSEA